MNDLTIGSDPVPVLILRGGERVEVLGRVVAPGLAITPVVDEKPHRSRYRLTHVPSGLAVGAGQCAAHIAEAVERATGFGIDWTADKALVVEAVKAAGVPNVLGVAPFCRGHCVGDGPQPPSWSVRCHTCDWWWDEEEDEGPLDAKAAKSMARDHECEPEVQIAPPDSERWVDPFWVNDDGTIRDSTRRATAAGGAEGDQSNGSDLGIPGEGR